MNKEFIPYQEALALKEIGFNEPCFGYYYTDNESNYKEHNYDYRRDFVIDAFQTKDGTYDSFVVNKKEREDYVATPTYSQAFRWFREKHDLKIYFAYWNGFNIEITEAEDMGAYQYECYVIPQNGMSIMVRGEEGNVYFKNYEEAELACLRALIRRARESTIGENTGPRG